MKSLGIDIQPKSITAALFDVGGNKLERQHHIPFPPAINDLPLGLHEVSPAQIIQGVMALLNDLCHQITDDIDVWITSRTGGVILVDDLGRAKSNFITWEDQRAVRKGLLDKTYLDRLTEQWVDPRFQHLKNELSTSSFLALLYALSEEEVLPDGVLPLSIADFVVSNLCRQPGQIHPSMAIGLMDTETNDWFYKALERIGLGDLWLPEVSRNLAPIGSCSSGQRRINFRPTLSEMHTSLLGSDFAPTEIAIQLSDKIRISTIHRGNGKSAQHSVPYFEQQRLLCHTLPINTIGLSGEDSNASVEPLNTLLAAVQSVLDRLLEVSQYGSILLLNSPQNNIDVEQIRQLLNQKYNKPVRVADSSSTLTGLLKLAQSH